MLTKAILTGGALSVLAGAIVYFGTEGAGALESRSLDKTVQIEETELAGGVDIAVGDDPASEIETVVKVAEVDPQDPPKDTSQPKTKWLDQYLKKAKSVTGSEPASEPIPETVVDVPEANPVVIDTAVESVEVETESEVEIEVKTDVDTEVEIEATEEFAPAPEIDLPTQNEKHELRKDAQGEATGTYIISKEGRLNTVDIEGLDLDALTNEDEDYIETLIEELGLDSEKNVEIRVIKKVTTDKPLRPEQSLSVSGDVDYDVVLTEAKKLLVTDMRNQAFLEILDHAIDQGDIIQAADIVDELSTPELRDTARARIGVGLALSGDAQAAFAVLESLEIDELSAPIRLEIITALMATKQERKSFASQ